MYNNNQKRVISTDKKEFERVLRVRPVYDYEVDELFETNITAED